jgi:hypothetical protein
MVSENTITGYRFEPDTHRYELLDPFTGNDLAPNRIPDGLLQDERLRSGFDFLQANSAFVKGTFVGVEHNNAKAAAAINTAAVNQLQRPIVFMENDGWETIIEDDFARTAAGEQTNTISALTAELLRTEPFYQGAWEQLKGSGLTVRFADIPSDLNTTGKIEEDLSVWSDAITEMMENPQWASDEQKLANFVAFQNYREWYMIGSIGRSLQQLTRHGEASSFIFVGGREHEDIVQKFNVLGLNVAIDGQLRETAQDERARSYTQTIGALTLTDTQLRVYGDYLSQSYSDDHQG